MYSRRKLIKALAISSAVLATDGLFNSLKANERSEKRISKQHIITLSFDDGFKKSSLLTAEIFEKHKLSACINVIATGHLSNFQIPDAYQITEKGDFGLWTGVMSGPSGSEGTSPGDRARRSRPEAIPLSPALARGAGRDEIPPAGRLRADVAPASGSARRCRSAAVRACAPKVVATVVQLLEKTLIRVGNDEYAKENQSFGLTTMRDGHVKVSRGRVRFAFRGKSGVEHDIDLDDRRLARTVKACRDIPGYDLFQYYDEDGERHAIGSGDVNAYLKEITGQDFTSKDFRTWAGTVLAAQLLKGFGRFDSGAQAKRNIVQAVESVAKRLGNTKAVCRKCYIHPAVFDAYLDGSMLKPVARRAPRVARGAGHLPEGEAAVLEMLQRRLATGNQASGELDLSVR